MSLFFESKNDIVRQLYEQALKVAPANINVLILGETGTGKEVLADFIYEHGNRNAAPFIKVNCAAIHAETSESELFGYEKGAFTGAEKRRIGKIEAAHNGTLFLDEIGDMPAFLQQKLLRAVDKKTFTRLGGNDEIAADVRFISATNKNLENEMSDGAFRNDLFYRLGGVVLYVPPLRNRREDLPVFIELFLKHSQIELNKTTRGFTTEALKVMNEHSWPGNLRELQHVIKRAVLSAEPHDSIDAGFLSFRKPARNSPAGFGETSASSVEPLNRAEIPSGKTDSSIVRHFKSLNLGDIERAVVIEALGRTEWVQKDAARLLGISQRAMNYKVKIFNLSHPQWKVNRASASSAY